jgi:hypothetical protein
VIGAARRSQLASLAEAKLAEWSAVRNPSAVVPADANARERRQPLDLLILKATSAVNGNNRPVRLRSHREVTSLDERCRPGSGVMERA